MGVCCAPLFMFGEVLVCIFDWAQVTSEQCCNPKPLAALRLNEVHTRVRKSMSVLDGLID